MAVLILKSGWRDGKAGTDDQSAMSCRPSREAGKEGKERKKDKRRCMIIQE